ncbi:MAG: DUF4214 domain-containing protein [Desulfobacteraceae bacterium]|nr:MAG: DUF4214 domain-containing protein [Desulfobacteraceae bacterium]
MKRIPWIHAIIAAAVVAIALFSSTFAYNLGGANWPNRQAAIHSMGGNSNPAFDNAFVEAMGNWNNLSNFAFISIPAFADPCTIPNVSGGQSGWAFSETACGEAFGPNTLAVNISWVYQNDGRIIKNSTLFNNRIAFDIHNGSSAGFIDFRRVATHELGHAAGLGHEDTVFALMNSFYSEFIEEPQVDDINGIRALYGGGDGNRAYVEAFVTRFYQQCLSRNPDPGGLAGWVNALLAGTLSGADVANGFIFSPEFIARNTTNEEFVAILYRAFFAREPDAGGYNGWVNSLNSGASRQAVLDGFTHSLEFENLCAIYGITPYFA